MELPLDLQSIISQYAKPASATLRPDWRKGSSIIDKLKSNQWFRDFITARNEPIGNYYAEETWVVWCRDKMIIGPPRFLREEAELDEDYLDMDDIIRHCRPWFKTWPASDDHSWCTGPHHTTLPDWVIAEFTASPNPTLC